MSGLTNLSGGGRRGLLSLAAMLVLAFLLSLLLSRFRVISTRTTRGSWYGGAFHGRLEASGRPYNMLAFTAAHRTLPLGSWVRVINLKNHRSVIVQVTDRGPYRTDLEGRAVLPLQPHPNRDLDLSYEAARKLGMLKTGVAPIKIEELIK